MALLGQKMYFSGKSVVFGKRCCIRAKTLPIGKKWLYSRKSGSIRAKVVVFGKKLLYLGKVVVFGQSGCIQAKVVVFVQKWFFSGKSCCIRAKWFSLEKVNLFGKKWLYSAKWLYSKVVLYGQKWFYAGKSGCSMAKFYVFAFSQVFSLLCLLFAKQSILKSPVDTQISLQKDFYGHSSFYMDESQLLKMFLLKRASRHFVMSVRMKFQKSRYRTLPIVQPHSTLQV